MGFVINKNIPRPDRHTRGGMQWQEYPFNSMDEGDSFYIGDLPSNKKEAMKIRDRLDARVRNAAQIWGQSLNLKIDVSIHKVDENNKIGLRCWVNAITDLSKVA